MKRQISGSLIGIFYLNGLILPLSLLATNIHDGQIVSMVLGCFSISSITAIILILAGFFKVGE